MDSLLQLINDFVSKIGELQAKISEMQSKLSDTQAALDQAVKEAYDKGFEDGKNSVEPEPSDKIYSQAELDAAVAGAVEPLNARIVELEAVVAGIDAKIAEEVAKKVSDIKTKLDELEASF